MDVRSFVNIHNLRLLPVHSHAKHAPHTRIAEEKLRSLIDPMHLHNEIHFERTQYEIHEHAKVMQPSDMDTLRRRYGHNYGRQAHKVPRSTEPLGTAHVTIPPCAFGVLCLAKENVCGGLIVAEKGDHVTHAAARHSRIAKDLPPGYLVLYPEIVTPFELLDPHEPGVASLLWLISKHSEDLSQGHVNDKEHKQPKAKEHTCL